MNILKKQRARLARKVRVRNKIHGTAARPRLAVFKSAKHIYVQLIDDEKGSTLASASSLADEVNGKGKDKAKAVGKLIAERAIQKGCATAVFDRSSYPYHGQIKELAEGAREAGLKM
jgi:large subunit ribosomal protein L18